MLKMKVFKDLLLVEEDLSVKEKVAEDSNIIIRSTPKTNLLGPIEGKVLEVGTEVKGINKGDTILYLPSEGVTYKKDGDIKYKFIKESTVLAVVNE